MSSEMLLTQQKKRRKVISSEMLLSPHDLNIGSTRTIFRKDMKKRKKVMSSEMLLSPHDLNIGITRTIFRKDMKKRRKVISSEMHLSPHDLNIGKKESTEKVTVPGTLRTSGFVSLKENSITVKDTSPDEAISTNGMLSMTKYKIHQKYGFVEVSN